MKKLSITEGELKKGVAYKKKGIVLIYRFSYFRLFTHDIITQNATHSNICIFIAATPQVCHMGREREKTKKAEYRMETV